MFHLPQPGSGVLSIKFTGELNDKMKGFYRSKYTIGEEERFAAVTQFEVQSCVSKMFSLRCRFVLAVCSVLVTGLC